MNHKYWNEFHEKEYVRYELFCPYFTCFHKKMAWLNRNKFSKAKIFLNSNYIYLNEPKIVEELKAFVLEKKLAIAD
jgi:hypothetical protein